MNNNFKNKGFHKRGGYYQVVLLFILVLFTACSQTIRKTVSLEADYSQEVTGEAILDLNRNYTFSPGNFTDLRYTKSPNYDSTYVGDATYKVGGIIKLVTRTYIYNNEVEISKTIFNALEGLVVNSGHQWDITGGDICIDVTLYDLTPIHTKIFLDETILGYTNMKTSFIDCKTNENIYESVYENKNDVTVFGEAFEIRIKRSLLMSILDIGRDKFLTQKINTHFESHE
ncbi:MAG: hypothetical protein WD607_11580 [Candidatus Paceibacterota bacterium]